MYNRCLATKFDVVDFEDCWAGLRSPQKLDMQGNGMWLVLFCEGRCEVCSHDLKYDASDIATVWYWVRNQ